MKYSRDFACLYGPPPVDFREEEEDDSAQDPKNEEETKKEDFLKRITDFFRKGRAGGADVKKDK